MSFIMTGAQGPLLSAQLNPVIAAPQDNLHSPEGATSIAASLAQNVPRCPLHTSYPSFVAVPTTNTQSGVHIAPNTSLYNMKQISSPTHQLINNHSANFNAPDFINSFPTLPKSLQPTARNAFPSHVPYNSGIIFPDQYGPQRFPNQQFPSLIAHHAQTFQGTPRYKLTPERAAPLMDWFEKHKHHPYPSRMEKISLCEVTQLNYTQVSNWFANARRRMKQRHKVSDAGTPENKPNRDSSFNPY